MRGKTIVLVQVDMEVRSYVDSALRSDGYKLIVATNASEIGEFAREQIGQPSLVLLDMTSHGPDGVETLRELRRRSPCLPILVVGGNGSSGNSMQAIQNGATAFLPKPFTPDQLIGAVRSALASGSPSPNSAGSSAMFYTSNKRMRAIWNALPQIALSDVPVVLRGESGVGKEVVAREIHRLSARRDKPLVKINCVALPSELLESELFGYKRGAFTGAMKNTPGKFEAADNSTILLDEIGDMDFKLQAKLLHVLQDHQFQRLGSLETVKVDVRVLAATHCNLEQAIRESRFREDLYYRLNVVTIRIPPLRERQDEILPLVRHFMRKHLRGGTVAPEITPALERALLEHSWPGNIRELENVIRRYLVFPNPYMIIRELQEREQPEVLVSSAETAPKTFGEVNPADCDVPEPTAEKNPPPVRRSRPALDDFSTKHKAEERQAIVDALVEAKWNRVRAAELLNIDYRKLLYKIRKLGIGPSRAAPRPAETKARTAAAGE